MLNPALDDATRARTAGPQSDEGVAPQFVLQRWPGSWVFGAAVALALTYFLAAKLGAALAFPSAPVSALWAPNAIVMAAFMVTPPRYWWAYLLALVPAHVLAQLLDTPLPRIVIQYVANCGLALLGAGALIRLEPPPWHFDRLRSVICLILCAGVGAPLLTSILMSAAFYAAGIDNNFWLTVVVRTLTNTFATLALVPLIVRLPSVLRAHRPPRVPRRYLETLTLALLLLLVGSCVFLLPATTRLPLEALLYAPLPVLLWAAIRTGTSGVCWSVLLLGAISTWGVLHGYGPFAHDEPTQNALSLVCFLVVSLIALLLLAALLNERNVADSAHERISTLHRAVLASLEDQIAVLDRDGRVLELNESWKQNFRRASGGLQDLRPGVSYLNAWRTVAGQDEFLGTLCAATTAVLADSGLQRRRFEFSCRVAEHVSWFELHIEPLRRAEGGVVLTVTDITARMKAEQEVRAQQHQLTHLTRTAMLGEFSAAVAHEINQPLAAILANSEAAATVLARPVPDLSQLGEILDDITSSGRRAVKVIRGLRLLFQQGEMWYEVHDLRDIISEVLMLARSELMDYQVPVETHLAPEQLRVLCDRVQIQQVLLNLFRNACEAMVGMPPGERRLILTTRDGPSTTEVELLIRDMGPGIPVESLDRIFSPSFTTKRRGMGLGLAISRSVLTAHGGRLRAENAAPGARLCVLLRRA